MKITAYICYNKKQSGWRKEEATEGKAMKKVSVRMLKIIDLLLEEERPTVSALSARLKLSTRQIRYDIECINQLHEGRQLLIETDNKGVLSVKDEGTLRMLRHNAESVSYSQPQRLLYMRMILAFDLESYNLSRIAEELSVSRMTVRNDMQLLEEELREKLRQDGYELYDIDQAEEEIRKISPDAKLFYDPYRMNFALYSAVPEGVEKIRGFDQVNDLKSVKNPVERENFIRTDRMECAALFKFFHYVKKHAADGNLNEYNVSEILYAIRSKNPEFLGKRSAPLMAAYMKNAAGPHYFPTEEENTAIEPSGVLLVDAVTHYYGGTTDITRTVYLGPCPELEELRKDYTLTLRSLMDLSRQVFREGVDGAYLDSVARRVMWNAHLQYGYGTGHGIGYCIVAHEGPQFISEPSYKKEWAFCFLPMKPGMVMALEPGVYKEGKYGVRLEDNLYITEDLTNEYGTFYRFQNMSYLPFERELIDVEALHPDEIAWLNQYHQTCWEQLSPLLDEEEKEALREATEPL